MAELQRLSGLVPGADWDWSTCAVIAREWSFLDPARSLCELEDIPVQLASEEFTGRLAFAGDPGAGELAARTRLPPGDER